VKVTEELLDAEFEHDSQSRIVGLEKNENAVEFFESSKFGQDTTHVFLVMLTSARVANSWSIDQIDA
jgi:hypothetical protein